MIGKLCFRDRCLATKILSNIGLKSYKKLTLIIIKYCSVISVYSIQCSALKSLPVRSLLT